MTTSDSRSTGLGGTNEPAWGPTLFGHPTGLFALFFAEMWERFSFYGMKALLMFYMIKGFLKYNDDQAYGVYGAYTALVYTAPFIGGMLADRLLGARRSVIIGGLLMAAGQMLLTVETSIAFFVALSLLICGNGFFKPNISTIVGGLYSKDSPKKDAGFTIFYMGINLGAAMAPIMCGYIGETYGWNYGFGLAAAGMMVGVAVFAAPTLLTQILIATGALGGAIAMPFLQDSFLQLLARLFLGTALATAGLVAVVALHRGGLPHQAGRPPHPERLGQTIAGVLRYDFAVYLGIIIAVPIVALLVQRDTIAGLALSLVMILALIYIVYDACFRCTKIERHRIFLILVLMAFSLLFWAFFEQAGSSVNNFTDRNIDRVSESRHISESDIGSTIRFRIPPKADGELAQLPLLTQEQFGYEHEGKPFTMSDLVKLREKAAKADAASEDKAVNWSLTASHVGMGVGGNEIPASEFQAVNPVYIVLLGLVFTALWGFLGARGLEPSTPVKFALGLIQLGLGFAMLWYGTRVADSRGMVGLSFLLLSYLFQTTGELCLSPVGLSMITKLSPARIVSTMMGAWFLGTAMSQFLAGQIAKFTSVLDEGQAEQLIPAPIETVTVYGSVYGRIAIAAAVSGLILFLLSPLLKRWEHPGAVVEEPAPHAQPGGFPVQKTD
ncbi:MAG: hypothetical protein KA354_06040 [Phycisphaerae bacterium]|nr:hypothetical protein [Phycisphaerae bacterium]